MTRFVPAMLLLAAAAPAPVAIEGAWSRAMLPGQDSASVYLTLRSEQDDALTGIAAGGAGMAMLHRTVRAGTSAHMEDLDTLPLPAGRTVRLAPGGTHIMLMSLARPWHEGDRVALTLHFAHAPDAHVEVPVRGVRAVGP